MADVKWIKITTDIFDDEKVLLIESMPDADAMIVIWFKLLCLAGKQNNSGVFIMNNKIAYTDEMLSTIFRRPVNTVRLALNTFESFGMIELINGVITIPNWDKHQSLDALEKKREYQKELMRKRRSEQKAICEANSDTNCEANVSSLDKNKNENKNREDKNRKEKNTKVAKAPVTYFPLDEKLDSTFKDYVAHRKEIKKPMTERAISIAINHLADLSAGDNDKAIKILEQSIECGWSGLFPLKEDKKPTGNDRTAQNMRDLEEWIKNEQGGIF